MTTAPAKKPQPAYPVPRPALTWEPHQLFQEPVYDPALALPEDNDEDEPGIITA